MKKMLSVLSAICIFVLLLAGCGQQKPESSEPLTEDLHREAQAAYYQSIGTAGLAEKLSRMSTLFTEIQNLSLTKDGEPNPECITPLQDKLAQVSEIYAEVDASLNDVNMGDDAEIERIHTLFTDGVAEYKKLIEFYANCAEIIKSYESSLNPEAIKALFDDLSKQVNNIKVSATAANKSFLNWQDEVQILYDELTSQ